MRKISIALSILLFSAAVQAQQPLTSDQQSVQQTVIKVFDALSNRDSMSLKLYCTDDVRFYEYGQTWNMDTLINKAIRLNTATDFKRINTIDFVNTTISNKVAWATYNNQAEITMNGKQRTVKWLETVVLVKKKNRWKLKVLHSTLIK